MNAKSVTIAHTLRSKHSTVVVHRITGWYSSGSPATAYVNWLRPASTPPKQASVGILAISEPGLYTLFESDKPVSYFFVFELDDALKIKFVDESIAIAAAMLMQSGVHGVPGIGD